MDPELINSFLADAWPVMLATCLGAMVGIPFGIYWRARLERREYLRGCTDTEKLIRNQQLKDYRS